MSEVTTAVEQKQLFHRTSVGFWLYLMTDCIVFASLFATFVVLRTSTAGGPAGSEIYDMPLVLVETIILLTSSFTCGMALYSLKKRKVRLMIGSFLITYVLGVAFLTIEISEFVKLIGEGFGPSRSAFLSAFFTLVGTHGFHIFIGLLWLLVLMSVLARRGISAKLSRQIVLFSLFWHFLDLVWIFIFTVVYLMGVAI